MKSLSFSHVMDRIGVSWSPLWIAFCGAICLILACWFPWMIFFNDPILPVIDEINEGAGGPFQEPIWFILSLFTCLFSLFKIPYRRFLLAIMMIAFYGKLWLVYRALTAWFQLNIIQEKDIRSQYAPFASYGPGWYLLILGCMLLFVYFVISQWFLQKKS